MPGGATRVAFVAALALAATGAATDAPALWPAAIVAATAGLLLLVLNRFTSVPGLSWSDAAMAALAVGAVVAAFDGGVRVALALGGAAAGLAFSRWQPSACMLLAVAGILALAPDNLAVNALAVPLLAAAAWRHEPSVGSGPDFRWTVLAAIVICASAALTILALGQFTPLSDTAGALAIAAVFVGMGRAGTTVTARIREADRRARCDELTGLGNRRHLLERLEDTIARNGELALLLIDLDGFKELNDTLGHHAGDEVLRQIGPRLAEAVREHDTLARLGGDEFALVLAPGDEEAASTAGLRLRTALERSFDVEGISVHINASVGIALYPEHGRTAMGLLQRADVAMYEAKRKRTGHEVYLPSRDIHSRERLALVGQLRDAIDAGELVLHYQPKASVATGAVESLEALVRWQHPERGMLAPSEFLPIAEQSGLTRALTAFVFRTAIEQMREWRRDGLDLSVAVNLGPADLLDLGLPAEIAVMLERGGCPPERVQLEVSEDVIMADPARTIDVLTRLRGLGVSIALDDFGAGHSSLSHLNALELDELKIDRSFVLRMETSPKDGAIVQSAIDLGRRLSLRVVAEGVATPDSWTLLAEWGCDEAQGFLVARPMPGDAVRPWLEGRKAAHQRR